MEDEPQAKSPVATTAKSPANSPIATTPDNNPTSGCSTASLIATTPNNVPTEDCSTASLISPDVSETDSSMGRKSRGKKRTQDGSVETAATVTPEKKNNNDTSTAKSSAEETTREALKLLKKALDILEKSYRPNPGTDGSDSDASNHSDVGLRAEAIQTTAKILGHMLRGNTAMTSSQDNSSQFYVFADNSDHSVKNTTHVGVNSGVIASDSTNCRMSSSSNMEDFNAGKGRAAMKGASQPRSKDIHETKHFYMDWIGEDKTEGLRQFCQSFPFTKFIVYSNSQEKVESAAKSMIEWNETASTVPENNTRAERQAILRDFLAGPTRMLISTDQLEKTDAMRKIGLIINLDLPLNAAIYRNRYSILGSQKKAAVITIVHREKGFDVMNYGHELGIKIDGLPKDIENIL